MENARQDYNQKIEDRKRQGREQLENLKKTTRLFWFVVSILYL